MWPAKTYTFSPSTTISSGQLNQNFDDLLSAINTAMPSGAVIMWDDLISNIPAGWYICDGNNGTKNLGGKVIVGAGQGSGLTNRILGDVGGEESHVLTVAELARHRHNTLMHAGHSYSNSGNGVDTGSATEYTDYIGSDAAHNNMQPFTVLAFIRKS